eukprot:g13526.t1
MAGTSLDRRKILGCANPNCPFRVCPDPELGGFCCISCYESFTYGVELTHTNRCQQSRAASWLPRAPPEAPKAILRSAPIKAWSNIYSVPTWMVSHEDLEEAMPEVEDEIVQEDCDGGHLPDTGKLSFSLGAVFEATDVYEVDPTLDEIELPTPKAPPKAKAPLLTPAQVPAANRDAEETVVFELEELQDAWDELAVCRSPAMSCAATPAMRAEQTETSPTVVSSGPVSVTKQEEDMMMARLLREINETNGAASAAATVISPARLGLAVSGKPTTRDQVNRQVMRAVMQATFPVKSVDRMNSLMRALHKTLELLFEAGRASSPDAAFVSDLFSATADGTQTPFIEEMRRQHLYEVLEFTAEISTDLIRSAGGESFVNLHGRLDPFTLVTQEEPLPCSRAAMRALRETMNVLMGYFPEVKCAAMVHVAWKLGDESSQRVAEVLQKFRHHFLLKHENAWVVVSPKAVVERVVELGPGKLNRDGTDEKVAPQRNRALKVLDNPYDRDERYTPQQLLKETSRVPRKFTEEDWPAAGQSMQGNLCVPSTSETAVQTERSAMRILQKPRPKVMPEEMMAQHYSDPDYRARVAAAKLMNILWAKEPSQVHLDQSLYGAAFVLPQIARSAGWPKELTVLVLKTFLVLFVNYFVQFAVLYFIATDRWAPEDMVWDLFSGQMYLCNFGKDAPSCPDGPNCIGPGGTVFTDSRYYSWDQWSVRIFARDAMKALFPDERADISRYADPGEYGVESNTCRFVCCGLYVVTVLDDLIGSYNLFKLMNSIESKESRPGEASPGGGRGPDQSEQQHLQGVQVHQTT